MQHKLIWAIALVVASLAAAAGGVRWLTVDSRVAPDPPQASQGGAGSGAADTSFNGSLPVEDRLLALERAIGEERYARQVLQEELFVLTSELETFAALRPREASEAPPDVSEPAEMSRSATRRRGTEGRVARLLEAGFPPGQAEWILQRESELQMEVLQARYDAERSGDAMDFFQSRAALSDALRDELGDADYERYLEASGRPTSVAVSGVLESSPAQRAGLRPGDEIVSYDGTRIFSMSDLTRQTLEGQPGEQVVVDVRRDGVSMQVVVPRGPIGISGGRRSAR